MKNLRSTIFYVSLTGICGFLIYWIVQQAHLLEEGRDIVVSTSSQGAWKDFLESIHHGFTEPLSTLLLQIVAILLTARLLGWVCIKIKQPAVLGEMIAGITLGPSLLGKFSPELFNTIFPTESLDNLHILSQIGLILFMFIIGMELDLKVFRNRVSDALMISHSSIILTFTLGFGLSYYLYQIYATPGSDFLAFGLFMSITMSVAAFPVLARIVQEKGLQKSRLGTIIITCAAIDDVTAWCLLAVIIAFVKAGSFVSALYTVAFVAVYVVIMIKVVRPFLHRIGQVSSTKESLSKRVVAIFLLVLLLSSYTTEVLGVHALIGAFLAGTIMPENVKFRNLFIEKIEDLAVILLLPLFFVYTGLRTQIGLLNSAEAWMTTGIIITVGVIGKFFGSALAAKFVKENWKDSLAIGALMNTRGLMELVILNIGYDLGIIPEEIFSMMVVMALVTTFMTGPALDLIDWLFRNKKQPEVVEKIMHQFKVLFAFGKVESGQTLMRLSSAITQNMGSQASISAMHIAPANELHHFELEEEEKTYFEGISQECTNQDQEVNKLFKISSDIDGEIIEEATTGNYDLLLLGTSESIYEGSLLGKIIGFTSTIINPDKLFSSKNTSYGNKFYERTNRLLSKIDIPVGVLIDKGLKNIDQIIMPVFFAEDVFLMRYVNKLVTGQNIHVIVWDVDNRFETHANFSSSMYLNAENYPKFSYVTGRSFDKDALLENRLVLISLVGWDFLLHEKRRLSVDTSSILIVRDRIKNTEKQDNNE